MYPYDYDDWGNPEVPEYRRGVCDSIGCVKRPLEGKSKCIDCAVDEALPGLFTEIESITQRGS